MKINSQWNVYRTRFLVQARQLTEPLTFIDAFGRQQSGEPGDYLVESDGVRRVTSRALFEDIYVTLANNTPKNGTPSVLARPLSRSAPETRARATA
jgi:hypothetical protein